MSGRISMFKPGTRWEISHWDDSFDDIFRIVYPNVIEQMMRERVVIRRDPHEDWELPYWIELA